MLPKVCKGGEAAPFLLQIRSESGKKRTYLRKKRLPGTGGMKAKEDRNQGKKKRCMPEGAGEERRGGEREWDGVEKGRDMGQSQRVWGVTATGQNKYIDITDIKLLNQKR